MVSMVVVMMDVILSAHGAIGVAYLPQREREQHYFQARLPQQFDPVIHLDETRAVEPI